MNLFNKEYKCKKKNGGGGVGRGLEYVNFCTKNPNLNFFFWGVRGI